MAYMTQFDNVVPIWGVQRAEELEEWLGFMGDATPALDEETRAFIASERAELTGDFCRGCGYCMPCPMGITINQCARMSLMLRRAPPPPGSTSTGKPRWPRSTPAWNAVCA